MSWQSPERRGHSQDFILAGRQPLPDQVRKDTYFNVGGHEIPFPKKERLVTVLGLYAEFRNPLNEFKIENLILLELSLENQSNYFLLPFVE